MQSINITLETLRNGAVRATGRHNGRTVAWMDGSPDKAKAMLETVMGETCMGHRVGESFDFTQIHLNDAAKAAFA